MCTSISLSLQASLRKEEGYHVLEELLKLANPRIAHNDIQPPPPPHHLRNQLLARFGVAHIPRDLCHALLCLLLAPQYTRRLIEQRLELRCGLLVAKVVDRDVGAVSDVPEGNCAPDASHAAGYGCGFAGEELCGIGHCGWVRVGVYDGRGGRGGSRGVNHDGREGSEEGGRRERRRERIEERREDSEDLMMRMCAGCGSVVRRTRLGGVGELES